MSEARKTSWIIEFEDNATPKIKLIDDSVDDLDETFDDLDDTVTRSGKNMGNVFSDLAKSVKWVSVGAGALLGASIKTSVGIDKQLTMVKDKAGMTDDEIKGLYDTIYNMSGRRTDMSEMLNMSETLASAGLIKSEIEGSAEIMEQMYRKTGDSTVTTDLMLTSKVAFGTDLSDEGATREIFDKVVKGSQLAKLEIDEITESITNSQSSLKGFNMTSDSSIATMTLLAEAGFRGSKAGTMINSTFNDMVAKAEDGKLAFGDFALELYDVSGNMKDLPSLMSELEQGMAGMNEEQRNTALNEVFGANSSKLVGAFLNQGADAYQGFLTDISDSNGTLQESYDELGKSTAEMWAEFTANMNDVRDSLGSVFLPVVNYLAEGLVSLTNAFKGLSPVGQGVIGAIVAIVASLYPLFSIGAKIYKGFSKARSAFKGIIAFATANPLLVAITAIIVVVGLLSYAIYKNWDTIKEVFQKINETVSQVFNAFKGLVVNLISTVKEIIANNPILSNVVELIKAQFELIKSVISNVVGIVRGIITGDWASVWEGAKGIVTSFVNYFRKLPSIIFGIAKGIVSKLGQGLKGMKNAITSGLPSLPSSNKPKKHRTGKDRIPYDNYPSLLHKDEMVLTKQASDEYRKMGGTSNSIPTSTNNSNTINQLPEMKIIINESDNPKQTGREVEKAIDNYFKKLLPQI